MSFIATKKFRIAALAVGLLFVGAVAAAGLFTGTVNSPVTVTSTATQALITITSASTPAGSCMISPESGGVQTVDCAGVSIGQGGSYTITVGVTNTGGTADNVSASAGTLRLAGSTLAMTSGPLTQSVGANGGTGLWTFTYTAGQTTGTDSAVITITG
jgi:hypothetical protein